MTQDKSVLIVSDRPDRVRLLARAITTIMPCRSVLGDQSAPAILPVVAVIDLDPRDGVAAAWVVRLLEMRVPCLVLTNAPAHIPDRANPALRVTAADTPRPTILSLLFSLIDAGEKLRTRHAGETAALEGRAHRACSVVADLFHAAQADRPISSEEADAGTDVILEAVSEGGIRAWLEVIGRYDELLYQHSLSVAGFAAAFGFHLKIPRADRKRLAKAALLHDIGKSKIPLAILNKPGALTSAEMATMRTHAAAGADMLARQEGFDAAMLDVVRHHHEMLDGSGYPAGLTGDAIPDLVRLVTICDIHSALTERRAYRNPLPHAEAHAIMLGMTGKLDMPLLRAFQPIVLQSSHGDALV
ncbi:HD-GYP domain-containing protein [Methylobacterium sp. Leaf106]|uniref:HD-GYP domain-containing protein n=1 Tax=Methylobacterium sp. Leaf106 TaxID=1736255 RepID=UPI000AFA266D